MSIVRSVLVCVSLFVVAPIGRSSPRQDPVTPAPAPAAKAQDANAAIAKLAAKCEAEDFDGAVADARALVAANPDLYPAWFYLGFALHSQGKIDEALPAHLEATKTKVRAQAAIAHYNAGCAYALKGDKDNALAQLELAVEKKVNQGAMFAADPDLKSLIGDPRFDALLAKRKGGAPTPTPKPAEAAPKFETVAYSSDRKGSRIIWLPVPVAPAKQMHVDWSPVTWNDEMATKLDAGEFDGKRWRFGKDFWTTFDTNADVTVGGVAIPAGSWFLTLVRRDGKIMLQFNDPKIVRASGLDPFVSDKLPPPAHEVELKVERGDAIAKELALELQEGSKALEAKFAVAFGPFRLSAPIAATATN